MISGKTDRDSGKGFHSRFAVSLAVLFWVLAFCSGRSSALAAAASGSLLKAKADAEAKGYIFETSRDEIVAKAKKEGRVRVLSTIEPAALKALRDAFKKKYPFIDIHVAELGSVDENQRFLLELKAGTVKDWDVDRAYTDFYEEFLPFQKKFDILGMAEHKVLQIPSKLIDPRTRNVVMISSNMNVIGYNKKLLPDERAPDKWEDFLKPEFKGRKFTTDIRPLPLSALVPGWGLEKTLDFARKLAAQEPVWGRGVTRMLSSVVAGEYAMVFGPNLGALKRAQEKDPTGALGVKIVEPVPIRLHEGNGVLGSAAYPYSGLLWLEFTASPEGLKIMDDYWPLGASVLAPGSVQEQLTRGKALSIIDWNHYRNLNQYLKNIAEAMGFPKAK
jgi:ABC-type Fe3+ transport system substrate-binding protein